jgi:hypothetical protein
MSKDEPRKTDGTSSPGLKDVDELPGGKPTPEEKKDQATLNQENIERKLLGGYTSKEHDKHASTLSVDHPFSLDERQRLDNDN